MKAHAVPDGDGARVTLRAGELEKAAVVTLVPAPRPADMTPRCALRWESEQPGPYPIFDGELTVGSDDDYNAFWLVIAGTYQPPGGLVGQVFDALVGHRIAETVTRGLGDAVRAEIEAMFAEEEQRKDA